MQDHILFATGIENSYPTVQGGQRRDQMAESGHYDRWREDFDLCKEVGARAVRWGPPYYKVHTGPGQYDWQYADEALAYLRELELIPIVDLCHFGVPDWVGNFQNSDWPALFADYAEAFARRYPWVMYYTPVNEILVCARFSGQEGIWNEQLQSDKAMVTAHKNMCRATLLAIERILPLRPDAVFFQSETAEQLYANCPERQAEAGFRNELRFLTFDFLYGHAPSGDVLLYLMKNGATHEDYEWFMEHGRRAAPYCVMGLDYYGANERLLQPGGRPDDTGPVLGWSSLARQYYERYRRPLMLTETNITPAEQGPDWLWKTWHSVQSLRQLGVPVVGYTWYSLTDQVDWDIQLREIKGNVTPNGLYTLDRQPQPAAAAFQYLATHYSDLPALEDFPIGGMRGPA